MSLNGHKCHGLLPGGWTGERGEVWLKDRILLASRQLNLKAFTPQEVTPRVALRT